MSLSLYTTAYSVLEFYYVKMLANADIYYQYRQVDARARAPPDEPEAAAAAPADGEALAQRTDALILRFHRMRLWARNALWASIVLLLCAHCSEIFAKSRLGTGAAIQFGILVAGAAAVPYTVARFRAEYRRALSRGVSNRAGRGRSSRLHVPPSSQARARGVPRGPRRPAGPVEAEEAERGRRRARGGPRSRERGGARRPVERPRGARARVRIFKAVLTDLHLSSRACRRTLKSSYIPVASSQCSPLAHADPRVHVDSKLVSTRAGGRPCGRRPLQRHRSRRRALPH